MMEGRGPFYVLVAQMMRAEEPLPESERILDMWEFRTAFGGAKCFYSVLVENRITNPEWERTVQYSWQAFLSKFVFSLFLLDIC